MATILTSSSDAASTPVAQTGTRHIELDAMRGFAVMGILLMNIVSFALPELAYINPVVVEGTDRADMAAWALTFLFVDGKMRGLFTLLFGASLMLIVERARATGEGAAGVHYRRMLWLGVFGTLHFYLLWWGDILFSYALVGCVAFAMRDWSARRLAKWGLAIYAVGFVGYSALLGGLFWLRYQAGLPGADPATVREYADAIREFSPGASMIAEEIALYRSGFGDIFTEKLTEAPWDELAITLSTFPETLPFTMFGMALYKSGFMTGKWAPARYRRVGWWSTLAGLVVMLLLLAAIVASRFDPVTAFSATLAWSMPARAMMTIGYAALLMLLIARFARARWMARVAAAGRMAFTNYLVTSIAMTFLFYGWGLGLFGTIGRWELYGIVAAMCAAMLGWSLPWLARFRYGPFEWLWRSLARGRVQSMT